MDARELYRKRKEAYTLAKRVHGESLITLSKEKKKMIDAAVVEATKLAEQSFEIKYGESERMIKNSLTEAEIELSLLRCPDDNQHAKLKGQYYHCKTCGYVWDDTSPAHY